MSRRFGSALVLGSALLLVLGACSDDDSGDDADTTETTAPTADTTEAATGDTTDDTATDDTTDDATSTTAAGAGEAATVLTADELCALLPEAEVESAVGTAPTEVRPAGNMCEYSFDGYVLRLQEYTGIFESLDGFAGEELNSELATYLEEANEEDFQALPGIADGAYQLNTGWVFIVAGPNLLLVDQGVGVVPDDFDADAVFADLAIAVSANL